MIDTCATDGMCATACPVGIDTGALVKRLRAEGLALVYISHRMHEITELADECTVFLFDEKEQVLTPVVCDAREYIEDLLGREVPVRGDGTVRAPGTLSSHYAPLARVEIVEAAELGTRARSVVHAGERVGVVTSKLPHDLPEGTVVVGVPADAHEYARSLYRMLREAGAQELDVLLAVPPPEVGIGAAVADRLRRAAGRPT
jgi:Fe-S oxidoreductase